MCGERFVHFHALTIRIGSSPRVWGTLQRFDLIPGKSRFIPTCVGNALPRLPASACRRFIPTCVGNALFAELLTQLFSVHPHVCGERLSEISVMMPHSGSSPRVWGTQRHGSSHKRHRRFIPTCVGNASPRISLPIFVTVHPHVCGERSRATSWTLSHGGSSPRVWGTPALSLCCAANTRFIPTCVGNAYKFFYRHGFFSVHPHVCGERAGRVY